MRKRLVVMLVTLFWLVPACLFQDTTGDRPLRVGWYRWPGWYPMAIAQDQDLFRRAGVDVVPVLYDDYTHMLLDLFSGRLDGCCSGLFELLRSGIVDLKVVLVTDSSEGAEGLVAVPDIRDPRDLAGKRVGIQRSGGGGELLIAAMLERHGLSARDLILVDLDFELVAKEMPHNIQAGYTWEPYLSEARAKGARMLFSTADIPGLIVDVVVFNDWCARDRGADVRAFVAAWFEAQALWMAEPEKASAAIARVAGVAAPQNGAGFRVFDLEANIGAFRDGDGNSSLANVGSGQVEFLVEQGYLSQRPDLGKLLDGSFLPARQVGP